MQSAIVKIFEVQKNRTHYFNFYSYDNLTYLDGNLSINGIKYPVNIIHTKNKSLLVRKEPFACIEFNPSTIVYGFLPPNLLNQTDDNFNFTILKRGDNMVEEYELFDFSKVQRSKIFIDDIKQSKVNNELFNISKYNVCTKAEELITI